MPVIFPHQEMVVFQHQDSVIFQKQYITLESLLVQPTCSFENRCGNKTVDDAQHCAHSPPGRKRLQIKPWKHTVLSGCPLRGAFLGTKNCEALRPFSTSFSRFVGARSYSTTAASRCPAELLDRHDARQLLCVARLWQSWISPTRG